MNPQSLLYLTAPYSRNKYAPEQIKALAMQKADYAIGIAFTFIAFIIQLLSQFLSPDLYPMVSINEALGLTFAVLIVSYWLSSTAHNYYFDYLFYQTGKVAITEYFNDLFERIPNYSNGFRLSEIKEGKSVLSSMGRELIGMTKSCGESDKHYLERIITKIGYKVPEWFLTEENNIKIPL